MPQVVVTIDGKTYRMACGPGEEAHLQSLAADIDAKISGLKDGVGQIGDQRLTIMAAIMTADELSELKSVSRRLGDENAALKSRLLSLERDRDAERTRLIARLREAAEQIEDLDRKMRGKDHR